MAWADNICFYVGIQQRIGFLSFEIIEKNFSFEEYLCKGYFINFFYPQPPVGGYNIAKRTKFSYFTSIFLPFRGG